VGRPRVPDRDDYVGYDCDYTAFVPLIWFDESDGLLWVNHEYVSFPFSTLAPGTPADLVSPPGAARAPARATTTTWWGAGRRPARCSRSAATAWGNRIIGTGFN
jgi:secreted PhoX family phosphatase